MIEAAWDRVRNETEHAGALRIDPSHPGDFFAAQDPSGRLGLLLFLESPPPQPPRLESVDIVVGERNDNRWGLGIWLKSGALTAPFAQLCDDIVASTRNVPADRIGGFVVARLHRWQELLESAGEGMSLSKLRGLIGELLLLRDALSVFEAGDVVRGWSGPFRAPQDFALPGVWVEVKATFPTARTVRISSADQLSAPGTLVLAVYSLTSLLPHEAGITAAGLATELDSRLRMATLGDLADEFQKRLAATGYQHGSDYSTLPFREDASHFFAVDQRFPRITPADLPVGIAGVVYDLDLGALTPFEVSSPVAV